MKFLRTVEEALQCGCPVHGKGERCIADSCMAWVEAESRIEREDHSNASLYMNKEAMDRGTIVKRNGPLGAWDY